MRFHVSYTLALTPTEQTWKICRCMSIPSIRSLILPRGQVYLGREGYRFSNIIRLIVHIESVLLVQTHIQSERQIAKGSTDLWAPNNVGINNSKLIMEAERNKKQGEKNKDGARKSRSEQIKSHFRLSNNVVEDVVTRSVQATIKKSTTEKNHMLVNLKPIMSYLSLLKKMTINRP